MAVALAIQQPSLPPAQAASRAAVRAFEKACVHGQLKLSPSEGRILKEDEETQFTAVLPSTWPKTRRVIVKLNYPPQTYLIVGDFGHLQAHSIASECILASGSISKQDAMAALMATAPGVDPIETYEPMIYLPEWTIDQPKKGFRSRMAIRDDGSIVLEVAMYNHSQSDSGMKQQ